MSMGLAIALAVILLIVGIGVGYVIYPAVNPSKSSSSTTTKASLTETGSSLFYPLMTRWAANYSAATISAASTGSGTGQSSAILNLVNMGASDGYLTNASSDNVANFPAAISAQLIFYNIPSFTGHLNLNGTLLAGIYDGSITNWNNPLIQAANPGVTLPSNAIVPYARADSSGDTFLFTSYVYMSASSWPYGAPSTASLTTEDTHLTGATGNSGMVSGIHSTSYSIGYVGISYMASAVADGLQYAAVGDNASIANGVPSGSYDPYILPTGGATGTIAQDANLGLNQLNFATYGMAVSLILGGSWAGAVTLVHGGGGSNPTGTSPDPYPLVNLEYLIIKLAPTSGTQVSSTNLAATVQFLEWAISTGNWATAGTPSAWINQVGFLPLTAEVAGYDTQILSSVTT